MDYQYGAELSQEVRAAKGAKSTGSKGAKRTKSKGKSKGRGKRIQAEMNRDEARMKYQYGFELSREVMAVKGAKSTGSKGAKSTKSRGKGKGRIKELKQR